MIYLSRSSASVLIFANFGLLLAVFCGHLVQLIFFGPLRAVEVEVRATTVFYRDVSDGASLAALRQDMVLHYRIPPVLYHLPG